MTVWGTASSLILDICWPHLEHMGEVAGKVCDLGRTESIFLAVSMVRKLAMKLGMKWPPQFKHSSMEWICPSDVSISMLESGSLQCGQGMDSF